MNARPRTLTVPLVLASWLFLAVGSYLVAQENQAPSQEASAPATAAEDAKPAEESKPAEASKEPKEIQLDGVFEAVQSVPISVTPDEWSELKVVEAVSHGTSVQRGDLLIRLETENLEKAIADAELELKLDRLSLAEAEFKFGLLDRNQRVARKAAEDADRIATEELKEFVTRGRQERIESAEQSEKSARNRLAYEEEELKQLEKMYAADDLTEETEEIILKRTRDSVDASRYSLKTVLNSVRRSLEYVIPRAEDELKDAVTKAALALEEIRETTSIQRKQQELQLQKQRVGLERKEEKLKGLRGDRRKMEITAPRDGVVYYGENKRGKWTDVSTIEAMLQPGGMVKAKAVVLTVVQPEPLRIRVSVPEATVRYFSAGAEVTVNPVAYPDQKLSAKVQELSPVPMSDGTFDAFLKVDVGRIEGRIVPGMKAKLTLTPAEK